MDKKREREKRREEKEMEKMARAAGIEILARPEERVVAGGVAALATQPVASASSAAIPPIGRQSGGWKKVSAAPSLSALSSSRTKSNLAPLKTAPDRNSEQAASNAPSGPFKSTFQPSSFRPIKPSASSVSTASFPQESDSPRDYQDRFSATIAGSLPLSTLTQPLTSPPPPPPLPPEPMLPPPSPPPPPSLL